MDLHIEIRDENGDVLRYINIYQDGSDSEGVYDIADWIRKNYNVETEDEFQPDIC